MCPKQFSRSSRRDNFQRETVHLALEVVSNEDNDDLLTQRGNAESVPQEGSLLACGETVLMQTAKTIVQNPHMSGHGVRTRLLLDCGSHRSYISSHLAQTLNLKMEKKEKISIVTFGSANPTIVNTQTTSIKLMLKDGSRMSLKVNVVPYIAGKMERVPMKMQDFEHMFSDYDLADDLPKSHESSEIDLLSGNDYYGDIILSGKYELSSGLFVMESKLGWLITGRIQQKNSSNEEPSFLCIRPSDAIT